MQGQMWPIQSELKAKRLQWGAPQNQVSWAYMKELREHNRTRKIYPVNPYIEVYQFRENLYGLFNQNCDGAGDVWQWLVIGPDKALLIDTAFGLGDMVGLIDEITGGKPIIAANTHHHPDHSFGDTRFGTVYCHELLVPYLQDQNARQWDYLFDENGNNIWLEFDRTDLPEWKDFEIIGVPDGHRFDLGDGYEVELVWTPGHAAGHAMFLDHRNRILFCGDDVCSDVSGVGNGPKAGEHHPEYVNLESFRDALAGLVRRIDEYDYLFPAHFMVNLENSLLPEFLARVDEVIKDPDDFDYEIPHRSPNGAPQPDRRHKLIRGFGTFAYTLGGVYRP